MQTQRRPTATECRPAVRRPIPLRHRRERSRPACAPILAGSAPPPLLSRGRELAELRGALAAALAGRGGVVLLAGEPGIGKTRLAGTLADEAAARGIPVWSGRCVEDGSAPSFWPWSTALRRGLDRTPAEVVDGAAGSFRDELARVFPALAPDALAAPKREDECDRARFRLFELVWRFVSAVAEPAGLVIVLDDLQWADLPSLRLLEIVASDVGASRVLVIATCRDTEIAPESPLATALAQLARAGARRLTLAGLPVADCARWVAASGVAGDAAELGAALHRETSGNPFYLGELVRLLESEGGSAHDCDPRHLPHDLREVLVRRLAPLGAACRRVLEVASLLDEPFDAHLLARVVDGDADDAATLDHLARAARDRILVPIDGAPGRYEWAHGLLRRVLADALVPSQRAAWHARIAAVLERHAAHADGITTRLVRHFAAAGTPEALRRAFDYACRGADEAARGLGWEEAVRLHELALDLAARSGAAGAERILELELSLARALRRAGDAVAARARAERVVAACRRVPSPNTFARAALLAVGPTPEFGRVIPGDRALLEEACRDSDALEDGLRARLFARLAGDIFAAGQTGQAERVLALCDAAAASARRAGDSGALAMALLGTRYAVTLGLKTRGADGEAARPRVASAREIIAAAEAGGEHEVAAGIRHLRAMGRFATGDRAGFNAEVDALATAAAVSHAPEALWLAEALAALRATLEGRFAEGRQRMDGALAIGRRLQVPNAGAQHLSQWLMWHHVHGRFADVAGEVDVVLDEHAGGGAWRPIRAWARIVRGDAAGARADLRTLLASEAPCGDAGVWCRVKLATLSLLCATLGDREHAPGLYERALRQTDEWIVDGCATMGPWDLVRGALALVCGRHADAVRHLERALVLAQSMQARPFVATAQVMLAEALLAHDPQGARGRAADLVDVAQGEAQALDLADVAARAARLRPRLETSASDAAVLRRDGEVWTVAFAGCEALLRDGKGPAYLATLLAAPGRDVHVLELAGSAAEPGVVRSSVPEGLAVGGDGGCEAAPDADALRAYRARLAELREEIDEADECCDRARAERLREELDFLTDQLAQTWAGRARARGPAETARKAVTKVLRTQIARLLDVHPALGEHLRASIRMGTFCSYAPAAPVGWAIGR